MSPFLSLFCPKHTDGVAADGGEGFAQGAAAGAKGTLNGVVKGGGELITVGYWTPQNIIAYSERDIRLGAGDSEMWGRIAVDLAPLPKAGKIGKLLNLLEDARDAKERAEALQRIRDECNIDLQDAAQLLELTLTLAGGRKKPDAKVSLADGAASSTARPRLPQDVNVNPNAPPARGLDRNVGLSPTQNARAQRDAARLRAAGAQDVRINQQQVNAAGERVGINRPDLQYTNPRTGQRVTIEYERTGSTRGEGHRERILANDSSARVILREDAN